MPTPTKKKKPEYSAAIKEAGDWKASVDLTLARHGKEIQEYARSVNRGVDALRDLHEDIRSLEGWRQEIIERVNALQSRVALFFVIVLLVGAIDIALILTR